MVILPDLCWEAILKKLRESNDTSTLQNVYNACPKLFGKFLTDSRTSFLFPKVWTILEKKLREDSDRDYNLTEDSDPSDDNMCPSDLYLARFKSMSKLRLVCKTWRDTLDTSFAAISRYNLENSPPTVSYNARHEFFEDALQHCVHFDQHDHNNFPVSPGHPHTVVKFFNHFQSTHVPPGDTRTINPFIGRTLSLSYSGSIDGRACEVFWGPNGLPRLLSHFGDHVHYLVLDASDYNSLSLTSFIQRTAQVLRYLPNLKAVTVDFANTHEPNNYQDFVIFPHLPYLSHVSLFDVSPKLANSLLCTNFHIEGLQIDNISDIDDYCIPTIALPNLKRLSVTFTNDAGDFRKLNRPEVNWPLETLSVRFDNAHFLRWSHVLQTINLKWANTLSHLAIQLPEGKGWQAEQIILEDTPHLNLELRTIQYLQISFANFVSLDFILPLRNTLKELRVTTDFDVATSVASCPPKMKLFNEQKVRIMGCDKVQSAQIFLLFPNLEKVQTTETFLRNGAIVRKDRKMVRSLA